ncbi:glycosyltransferase [Riemerella anatipestifer]|nr:glycosyltransferase [Riemerella anatipestifer]
MLSVINSLDIGGAEKLLTDSIPFYKEEGVEMEVLLLKSSNSFLEKILEQEPTRVFTLFFNNVYNPFLILKIIPYLKKYDVIHVHLFPALYWVVFAKWISASRTPVVYTEHSTHNRRRNFLLFKWIDRIIYRGVSRIVSISDDVDVKIKRHLQYSDQKFQLIYNGIDIRKYEMAKPYKKSYFFDEDSFILVQVSSFRFPKDQRTVILALKMLPEKIKLLLVGQGELEKECRELVRELGLEGRVKFLGLRNDIPEILKTCDVSILSSRYEGLSLSCIEGMASGTVFIASKVPGLENIVDDYGILFPVGKSEILAEKIMRLYVDKSYYQAVSIKCLSRSKYFDIQNMVKSYIQLYNDLMKRYG